MSTVESAIVRFKSFSDLGRKRIVRKPNIAITCVMTVVGVAKFHAEKTPAMTSVAECRRLETGVGPSMASGSQRYETKLTDLKQKARSKKAMVSENSVGRNLENAITVTSREISPRRLKPMAENPELVVNERCSQVDMSKKLMNPTISQVSRSRNPPRAERTNHTAKRNETSRREKATYDASNSRYSEKLHKPRSELRSKQTRKFHTETSVRSAVSCSEARTDTSRKAKSTCSWEMPVESAESSAIAEIVGQIPVTQS